MKKLTASNDSEGSKPKQGLDMRTIDIEGANKKPGVGSRFTKIGGGGAAAGGGRFKKVGVAVSGKERGYEGAEVKKEDSVVKTEGLSSNGQVQVPVAPAMPSEQTEVQKEEDVVMADDDAEEPITWEEYDFTKPTGCDHTSCPGCKTDGIWSGEWIAVDTA
jgi:hypothetical protein